MVSCLGGGGRSFDIVIVIANEQKNGSIQCIFNLYSITMVTQTWIRNLNNVLIRKRRGAKRSQSGRNINCFSSAKEAKSTSNSFFFVARLASV